MKIVAKFKIGLKKIFIFGSKDESPDIMLLPEWLLVKKKMG